MDASDVYLIVCGINNSTRFDFVECNNIFLKPNIVVDTHHDVLRAHKEKMGEIRFYSIFRSF